MSTENKVSDYVPGYIDGEEAYRRGYDCGINGVNDWNCNFKIFSTQEKTKEWERGKREGEKIKNLKNKVR